MADFDPIAAGATLVEEPVPGFRPEDFGATLVADDDPVAWGATPVEEPDYAADQSAMFAELESQVNRQNNPITGPLEQPAPPESIGAGISDEEAARQVRMEGGYDESPYRTSVDRAVASAQNKLATEQPVEDLVRRGLSSAGSTAMQAVSGIAREVATIAEDGPGGTENFVAKGARWTEQFAKDVAARGREANRVDPEYDRRLASQIVEGAGSLPAAVAAGPRAPLVIAGMMGEQQRAEAEEAAAKLQGEADLATDPAEKARLQAQSDQALASQDRAFYSGAAIGAVSEALLGVPALLRSAKAAQIPFQSFRELAESAAWQAGKGAVREGAQEGLEQVAGNIVANTIAGYDPNRGSFDGFGHAVMLGAIIGAPTGAIMQAASDYDSQDIPRAIVSQASTESLETALSDPGFARHSPYSVRYVAEELAKRNSSKAPAVAAATAAVTPLVETAKTAASVAPASAKAAEAAAAGIVAEAATSDIGITAPAEEVEAKLPTMEEIEAKREELKASDPTTEELPTATDSVIPAPTSDTTTTSQVATPAAEVIPESPVIPTADRSPAPEARERPAAVAAASEPTAGKAAEKYPELAEAFRGRNEENDTQMDLANAIEELLPDKKAPASLGRLIRKFRSAQESARRAGYRMDETGEVGDAIEAELEKLFTTGEEPVESAPKSTIKVDVSAIENAKTRPEMVEIGGGLLMRANAAEFTAIQEAMRNWKPPTEQPASTPSLESIQQERASKGDLATAAEVGLTEAQVNDFLLGTNQTGINPNGDGQDGLTLEIQKRKSVREGVSKPQPAPEIDEQIEIIRDVIETKKANKQAIPDTLIQKLGELQAKKRGESNDPEFVFTDESAPGHPFNSENPVLPIKIEATEGAAARLDFYTKEAQKRIDAANKKLQTTKGANRDGLLAERENMLAAQKELGRIERAIQEKIKAKQPVAETIISPADTPAPVSPGTGPRVISTAFQRDGKTYVGEKWNEGHEVIGVVRHPKLGVPKESERGFLVEDAQGNRHFVSRAVAGPIAAAAGQTREGADLDNLQSQDLVEKAAGELSVESDETQTAAENVRQSSSGGARKGPNDPFEVGEELIMRSPFTNDDVRVNYRGPLGDKSVVVMNGSQMSIPTEWLRRDGDSIQEPQKPVEQMSLDDATTAAAPLYAQMEALGDDAFIPGTARYTKEAQAIEDKLAPLSRRITQLKDEQRQAELTAASLKGQEESTKRITKLGVFQKRNGWEIIKDGPYYVLRDPFTKEEVYKNGKLSRVREVADESKPEPPNEPTRITGVRPESDTGSAVAQVSSSDERGGGGRAIASGEGTTSSRETSEQTTRVEAEPSPASELTREVELGRRTGEEIKALTTYDLLLGGITDPNESDRKHVGALVNQFNRKTTERSQAFKDIFLNKLVDEVAKNARKNGGHLQENFNAAQVAMSRFDDTVKLRENLANEFSARLDEKVSEDGVTLGEIVKSHHDNRPFAELSEQQKKDIASENATAERLAPLALAQEEAFLSTLSPAGRIAYEWNKVRYSRSEEALKAQRRLIPQLEEALENEQIDLDPKDYANQIQEDFAQAAKEYAARAPDLPRREATPVQAAQEVAETPTQPPPQQLPPVKPGFVRLYRGGTKGQEGNWFSDSEEVARFHFENHGQDAPSTLSYIDVPESEAQKYSDAAWVHPDVESGNTIAEGGDHVLPDGVAKQAKEFDTSGPEETGLEIISSDSNGMMAAKWEPNSVVFVAYSYPDYQPLGVIQEPHDGTNEGIAKSRNAAERKANEQFGDVSHSASFSGATDASGFVRSVVSPNGRVDKLGTAEGNYALGDLNAFRDDALTRILKAKDSGDFDTANKLAQEQVDKLEADNQRSREVREEHLSNIKKAKESFKKGGKAEDFDFRFGRGNTVNDRKDYLKNLERHIEYLESNIKDREKEQEKWRSLITKTALPPPQQQPEQRDPRKPEQQAEPIRFDPTTGYNQPIKNGDIVTDGTNRYVVTRAQGFTIGLDILENGRPKVWGGLSVDPTSPEFRGDLTKTGENLYESFSRPAASNAPTSRGDSATTPAGKPEARKELIGQGSTSAAPADTSQVRTKLDRQSEFRLNSAYQALMNADAEKAAEIVSNLSPEEAASLLERLNAAPGDNKIARAALESTQPPEQAAGSFKTAKGSSYVLHSDGTTSRNKAARPEHPGDSGSKDRSQRTVYVSPEMGKEIGMWQTSSAKKKRIFLLDGKVVLTSWNENAGKQGRDRPIEGTDESFSTSPSVGLHPLELWLQEKDGGFRGNHPGSAITEISSESKGMTRGGSESGAIISPQEMLEAIKQAPEQLKDALTKDEFTIPGQESDPLLASFAGKVKGRKPSRLAEFFGHFKDVGRAITQRWSNSLDSLGVMEKEYAEMATGERKLLPAEISSYKQAVFSHDASRMAEYYFSHGIPEWKNGSIQIKNGSKGLTDTFREILTEKDQDGFDELQAYFIARRAKELMEQGKENLFSGAEIDAVLKKFGNDPLYQKAFKEYREYSTGVLNFAVQSHLISKSFAEKLLEMHKDYVPFYRLLGEEISGPVTAGSVAEQQHGIRRIKGGTNNVADIYGNIEQNLTHLISASIRNVAMFRADEQARLLREGGKKNWMEPVAPGSVANISNEQIVADLKKQGVGEDLLEAVSEDLNEDDIRQLWNIGSRPKGDDIIGFRKEGKQVYRRVNDPLLFDSLTATRAPIAARIMGVDLFAPSRAARRIFQRGITDDPSFALANFIRDSFGAWLVNPDVTVPFEPAVRGLISLATKRSDMERLAATGALGANQYQQAVEKPISELTTRPGITKRVLSKPKDILHFYERMLAVAENANRAGMAQKALNQGMSPAEAAWRYRDSTIDFSLRGDAAGVRWMAENAPFFNAAIQSLTRTGRGIRENPKTFFAKASLMAIASSLLYLRNRDDEDYEALPSHVKDSYWVFSIGEEGNKHMFFIPKPFEVGYFFGSIPERITAKFFDTLNDRPASPDTDDTGKQAAVNALSMMRFLMSMPSYANETIEQWANKDTYTGRPIVPDHMEFLPPAAQKYPSTGETEQAVADFLNISPLRVRHAVGGLFGKLGQYTLDATNSLYGTATGKEGPSSEFLENPVISRFVRSSEKAQKKWGAEFYETSKAVDGLVKTVQMYEEAAKIDRAAAIKNAAPELANVKRAMDRRKRELTDVNNKIESVYGSSLTPLEKRNELSRLNSRKNEIAKAGVELGRRAYPQLKAAQREASK